MCCVVYTWLLNCSRWQGYIQCCELKDGPRPFYVAPHLMLLPLWNSQALELASFLSQFKIVYRLAPSQDQWHLMLWRTHLVLHVFLPCIDLCHHVLCITWHSPSGCDLVKADVCNCKLSFEKVLKAAAMNSNEIVRSWSAMCHTVKSGLCKRRRNGYKYFMYASKLFVQRLLLLMVTGQWLLQLWISDACAKGCTDLQSPRNAWSTGNVSIAFHQ